MERLLVDFLQSFDSLSQSDVAALAELIHVERYTKGTPLLAQGEEPTTCYFVLQGCVRQYSIDENGREVTFRFITENESVTIYNKHSSDKRSKYALVCSEDCVLIQGSLADEEAMYAKFPALGPLTRTMMEASMGEMNDQFATFMALKPEQRVEKLMRERPSLFQRVPQHQLASYLGVTAESLSRIKKRLEVGGISVSTTEYNPPNG
ncbi:MAG: Crp/Fnr family transcriptional regulator [Bacilli bacterium]